MFYLPVYEAATEKETMISDDPPSLPWNKVSTDLFDFEGNKYLATIDRYSGFLVVDDLYKDTTAPKVIRKLKTIFETHGIPGEVKSDNGPPFNSEEFKKFSKHFGFKHTTVSPRYPQANGLAEKAVQIAKNLLTKAKKSGEDPCLVMLDYRNTPRDDVLGSPVQRCMNRRTRTRFPTTTALLQPRIKVPELVTAKLADCNKVNKSYYDKRTKDLPPLEVGETVRYRLEEGLKPGKWQPCQGSCRSRDPQILSYRDPYRQDFEEKS